MHATRMVGSARSANCCKAYATKPTNSDAGFDLVISAFGAMFFADPSAALANIARSLRVRGRLALLAWRELQLNEWVNAIRDALSLGRALPTPPVGAPGPFGLADRNQTERLLSDAGFVDVSFEEVNEPIRFGDDADDAFSFVSTFGITKGSPKIWTNQAGRRRSTRSVPPWSTTRVVMASCSAAPPG